MESILMELGAANGIWAALFVCLFLYVLYDTRRREKEYQSTIQENQSIIGKLSDTITVKITCMEGDIKDIKERI